MYPEVAMKLRRRELLRALAPTPLVSAAPLSRPPHILFVLSDDHSYPYLGAYGVKWLNTPNLDRLAEQGVLFERAFVSAPQCVPSRVALMTGRSPVAARMGRFSSPLPPEIPTVPELLRTRNYYTGVCGRYFHLDGVVARRAAPVTAQTYAKHALRTWPKRTDFLDVSSQDRVPELFEQFLRQAPKNHPWFFWINYSDPHHPWDAQAGSVDPARLELPPHLPDLPGIREDLARYCSEIERLDRMFGELMMILRRHGLERQTLILFTGDNGMAFPHGKGSLYDPGIHVPLIACWPGEIKPGRTQSLISGEDVAVTLMEAGGSRVPPGVTGRSFWPLLTGGSYQQREYVFAGRFHHGNGPFRETTTAAGWDLSRCVRSARNKLIYNVTPMMEYQPVDSARDPGWQQMVAAHGAGTLGAEFVRAYFTRPRPVLELYDLETDPGELHNLAGRPEVVDLQRRLMEALQEKIITDYDFVPPVLPEAVS